MQIYVLPLCLKIFIFLCHRKLIECSLNSLEVFCSLMVELISAFSLLASIWSLILYSLEPSNTKDVKDKVEQPVCYTTGAMLKIMVKRGLKQLGKIGFALCVVLVFYFIVMMVGSQTGKD